MNKHQQKTVNNELKKVNSIARFTSELHTCTELGQIYPLLADICHELTGCIVVVSNYDEKTNTIGVADYKGLSKFLSALQNMAKENLLNKRIPLKEIEKEIADTFSSPHLHLVPGGFYSYCFKQIPRFTAGAIEKLLNINLIYSKGFFFDGFSHGTLAIMTSHELSPEMTEIVDHLGNSATLALQRLIHGVRVNESEKKYRLLAENARDVIWTLDMDLNFTYVSPSNVYLTGYTPEEQLDLRLESLLTPESLQLVRELFMEEMQNEQKPDADPNRTRIVEFEEYKKGGGTIWIEGQMSFLRDEQGRPIGILGVSRDITRRKEGETNLIKSENALRTTIDSVSDAMFVIDTGMKIRLCNKAFSQWCSKMVLSCDVLNKDLLESLPFLTIKSIREYEQIFLTGKTMITEEFVQTTKGELLMEVTKIPIWEESKVYRVLTIYRDITLSRKMEKQIRENEIQLRTIMDNIPDAIIRLDNEMNILYANPALVAEFGSSFSNVTGKNFKMLSMNETLDPAWGEAISASIQQGITVTHALKRANSKTTHHYIGKVIPEINLTHKVVSVLAILRDITEIKLAQENMINLNNELEKRVNERTASLQAANKELESFTYSVSHDLRTPLRALNGYANILLEDYQNILSEEGVGLLEGIIKNTHRMGQLIDDLLEFARIRRSELRYQRVDMKKLCTTVIRELVPESLKKKIHITIYPLPSAWCDRNLIRQVISNLISNSLKYSAKKEQIEIEIGAKEDMQSVVYSIKDNGVGFDMKYADKLFKVFQRLHCSPEFEGTGVGLAIVAQIIHYHGGNVWAEGIPNEGATLRFSLPKQMKNGSEKNN
jgi:PAS domain S-box-containing protein